MGVRQTLVNLIREQIGDPITGIELGIFEGKTSKALLEAFPKLHLTMVDPWKSWPEGSSYQKKHRRTGKLTQKQWDDIHAKAIKNVEFARDRVSILQLTSKEAVLKLVYCTFNVLFLDSNHTYSSVKQDLEMWIPKIRKDGIFILHDFGGTYHGVRKAVLEVFREEDLILRSDRICGIVIK